MARDESSGLGARFVQEYLSSVCGLTISDAEAEVLVPLVRAQRAQLDRLMRFDVADISGPVSYDPQAPYVAH